MKYKYPDYYKFFQCTANACEATCCAGWEIVIDEDSIEEYLNIRTEFGNRLCNSIDFQEGIFHQDEKKRCAFLNEENLCDIYTELGEEALCYTCTQYPRHMEEFEDGNEVSLSISCPEVAKLILSYEEKVTFYEEEIEEEVEPYEEFDFLFYEMLYEVRQVLFLILQNRNWDIAVRMEVTTAMIREVQEKVNDYELFLIDEIVQKYEEVCSYNIVELEQAEIIVCQSFRNQYETVQSYIMDLYKLEVLQEEWRPYLLESQTHLYEQPFEEYQVQKSNFSKKYKETLERMKEQLMVYFVYSYLCGAVYDGEILSKYLLAYITTRIVEELWLAKYIENNGTISEKEMQKITYQYAREIEHSDDNLEMLEELYKNN